MPQAKHLSVGRRGVHVRGTPRAGPPGPGTPQRGAPGTPCVQGTPRGPGTACERTQGPPRSPSDQPTATDATKPTPGAQASRCNPSNRPTKSHPVHQGQGGTGPLGLALKQVPDGTFAVPWMSLRLPRTTRTKWPRRGPPIRMAESVPPRVIWMMESVSCHHRGAPGWKGPPTQEESDQGGARRPDELGDPRVRRMEGGPATRRGAA